MVKLKDICTFQSGGTPSKTNPSFFGGNIPWISTVALNGGRIDGTVASEMLTQEAIEKSAAKIVPAHSIMVGTRVGIGKTAINNVPMSTSQDIISLIGIDESKWDKDFLCKLIASYAPYFNSQARGATIKGIKIEILANIDIPELSIQEQQHISSVIDSVTSNIASHKELLCVYNEAIRSRFLEMFGNPNINPMGWDKVPLSECLTSIENGRSFVCDTAKRTGENPAVLKLGAVTYGYYQANENKAMFEESQFVASAEVHKGDLLFTRKNTPELVGMSAYVYDTPPKLMMPDLIFRLNTKANCHKMFLWKLINLDLFRPNISALSSGSAKSMSNISKERLMGLEIILPPIELQEQFADFVMQVDEAKKAVQESLDNLEILKKSLMQKYFG